MASSLTSLSMLLFLAAALLLGFPANAQLSRGFHDSRCPNLRTIVRDTMRTAVSRDRRMAASILRMFFHDCFVNGCDGSVLLDDTSSFTGEKGAPPNANSLRGFEVIDDIKSRVEAACPNTVSCADILALAARKGVELDGGPTWDVQLGRRDSRTASLSAVTANIPSPFSNLQTLISSFANKGFSANEMVALSGAHTIGFAQCRTFRSRIYNDTNIDPAFATERRANCPSAGGDSNLAALDRRTPGAFRQQLFRKAPEPPGASSFGSGALQWRIYRRSSSALQPQ